MDASLALFRLLLVFTCGALADPLTAAAPDIASIEKIDVHAHIFEDPPPQMAFMRANNIRAINVCNEGRKGQALGLPRDVLEKYYHGNARRIYRLGAGK